MPSDHDVHNTIMPKKESHSRIKQFKSNDHWSCITSLLQCTVFKCFEKLAFGQLLSNRLLNPHNITRMHRFLIFATLEYVISAIINQLVPKRKNNVACVLSWCTKLMVSISPKPRRVFDYCYFFLKINLKLMCI